MVELGLDYSFSHPDEGCAAQLGYSFAARYIGDPDPNSAKYLDASELADIRAAGQSVVAARETTAGFMFTDDGAAHARASRAHCDQLGLTGIPIYYALDVDPRQLDAHWRGVVAEFLSDAAAADGGGYRVGLYGAYQAMEWWVGQPYCHWGWQTYAWSAGRISAKAHFRQYLNGQTVCGGTVDLNETYATDFGQWPRPNPPQEAPLSAAEVTEIKDHVTLVTERMRSFLAGAPQPEDPTGAVFLITRDGTKRWMATQAATRAAVADSVRVLSVASDGTVTPFTRSREHLEALTTVGDIPPGW